MAAIVLDGESSRTLASKGFTSATTDTGTVPSWARRVTVSRAGTVGTDDAVLTLARGSVTVAIPIPAGGAPIGPWPLISAGAPATTWLTWSLAGTASQATTIVFDRGGV